MHGGIEASTAVMEHPDIVGVSFVGSTPVAKIIYETCAKHGKRVQANGGAKNHILIMPDADMDRTVSALKSSAFGCSGQRCMAGSLAVAIGDAGDPLVERLTASAEKMKVGPTDRDWGQRTAYVRDPDGYLIELAQSL